MGKIAWEYNLMRNEIIDKLTNVLNEDINTEAQVVYILVEIRKLIKRGEWQILKLFCDWALHTELDRNPNIDEILKEFDSRLEQFNEKDEEIKSKYLSLKKFKNELTSFLTSNRLPQKLFEDDKWHSFLRLYTVVVNDCPLYANDKGEYKFIKEIRLNISFPELWDEFYRRHPRRIWLQWIAKLVDESEVRFSFFD